MAQNVINPGNAVGGGGGAVLHALRAGCFNTMAANSPSLQAVRGRRTYSKLHGHDFLLLHLVQYTFFCWLYYTQLAQKA